MFPPEIQAGEAGSVLPPMDTKSNIRTSWEPLLTPSRAGAYLQVHEKTVIRFGRRGIFPGLRLGEGVTIGFVWGDLAKMLATDPLARAAAKRVWVEAIPPKKSENSLPE